MKKILITGAEGQLGRALNQLLVSETSIERYNTEIRAIPEKNGIELDITNFEQVMRVVKEIMPDVIINCAAHTAVDLCEKDEENAYQINAQGPKNLALAAQEIEAVLVHISTDYVFDGDLGRPYVETDEVNPQSVYGCTKLAGERFVQENCEKYFIIRTAWMYGDGRNFVKTMLRLSDSQSEVKVVADQYGTPTSAVELARLVLYLCGTSQYGLYHGTCEGSASWYEFAVQIFKEAGRMVKTIPISTMEYKAAAKRPVNSILENKKLKQMGSFSMKDWKVALKEYMLEVENR